MITRWGAIASAVALTTMVSACSQPDSPAREPLAGAQNSGGVAEPTAQAVGGEGQVALCQHKVPADLCTRCRPELAAAFKELGDWCEEHGVPESQCLECHPDLNFAAKEPADWCKEHAVPETMCTKCHPELVAKFIEANDYCREHGYPASVCPICRPDLVKEAGAEPPEFPKPGTKVRLESAETARDVGVETQPVSERSLARTLDVVGQLEFARNRHAQLSARGDALVIDVPVDIGDDVKNDQTLVVLASASVGSEQARLSAARIRLETAKAALERERGLAEGGVSSRKDLEGARRELAAAQGDYDSARAGLGAAGASIEGTGGRYVLTAPFSGTVVARDAVAGKTATSGEVLIEVADLSTMWARLDVPEGDAALVRPGQTVLITLEGRPGETLRGEIARVGASVDPHSRTVQARAELPNPNRSLKAGAFLRAKIEIAAAHDALVVPRAAIQRAESRTLVFVHEGNGAYAPVAVELGAAYGDTVEVLKGLSRGDEVVTTGAFLLKTEILKGSIGAGCCDEGSGE